MKRCSKCGEEKELSEYSPRKGVGCGLNSRCKKCISSYAARWREEHPTQSRAAWKKWQLANRPKQREATRIWREANRERSRASSRQYRQEHLVELQAKDRAYAANHRVRRDGNWLRWQYGMTLEKYEKMLESQGGVCAICGNPPPSGKRLHIDHEHGTGTVRGLLCGNCNRGIGIFKDDPERMREAANYVQGRAEARRMDDAQ